jgi:hypothetical protein
MITGFSLPIPGFRTELSAEKSSGGERDRPPRS